MDRWVTKTATGPAVHPRLPFGPFLAIPCRLTVANKPLVNDLAIYQSHRCLKWNFVSLANRNEF